MLPLNNNDSECTYLQDNELELAEKNGHTHYQQLKPLIEANKNTTIVLTHFSARYSDKDILSFFDKENQSNVIVWVDDHPLVK